MPLFFAMNHKQILKAVIATAGFVIVGWLSFMRPDWLLLFGILLGTLGYLLLLIAFTPVGKLQLGSHPPQLTRSKWLLKLVLSQLVLLFFTGTCGYAFMVAGPEFSLSTVTLTDLRTTILDYGRFQWGLFPWSAIGLWGLVIAYITYVQQGEPYLYQAGRYLYPKKIEPMFKTYIESTTSGATMLLLAIIASAIILLYTYAINFYFKVSHFTMPVFTVIMMSFIGPLASMSMGRKLFRKLSGGRTTTLNRALLVMIGILIPIIVASAFVAVLMMARRTDLQQSLVCKECGNYFSNVPVEDRLAALYWGWWLLWTPLAGSYLAKISSGRTIREFVLGLYLVPLLIVFFGVVLYQYPLQIPTINIALTPIEQSIGQSLLASMLLICMLYCFKSVTDTGIVLSGFMKPKEESAANRLWLKDPSKTVGINRFSPKLLMAILGTIFLHATAGWFGVQLQAAAMAVLVMNAVYMGCYLGVYQLWRSYTHSR